MRRRSEPGLAVGRYRLRFEEGEGGGWRGYLGSAWRGVLGRELRRLTCVTQCERCEECLLYRSCVYSYVFETPPPAESGKLAGYTAAPHPFVLRIPEEGEGAQGGYALGLTLFGRGNVYLGYLVEALRRAGERGLQRERRKVTLKGVEQETAPGSGEWRRIHEEGGTLAPLGAAEASWPEMPKRVRLALRTPLRLRHREEYVGPERFSFRDLFANLLRRMSLLMYFHTEEVLETDFVGLVREAEEVRVSEAGVRWQDWARYSGRQKTRLLMGGLVGEVVVETEGHERLWPYLWLGQYTHAGKGTSMGLGRYEVGAREEQEIASLRGEESAGQDT